MTRPLGKTQLSVLESLIEYGGWYPGGGWHWNNVSGTSRIMESLVRRGLAESRPVRDDTPPVPPYGLRYKATAAGVAAVDPARISKSPLKKVT